MKSMLSACNTVVCSVCGKRIDGSTAYNIHGQFYCAECGSWVATTVMTPNDKLINPVFNNISDFEIRDILDKMERSGMFNA